MSAPASRPAAPSPRQPGRTLRPNRAEIVAGLSILIALLSLMWSRPSAALPTVEQSRRESPVANVDLPPFSTRLPAEGITLDDISTASAELASQAARSVVRVESGLKGRSAPSDDLELYFGSLPSETVGAGFVVDSQGHVLTNYHVIRGAEMVTIRGVDHQTHPAQVVGHDPLTDLALLHVADLNLPALGLGDSRRMSAGHLVWAIGSPFGLDQSVSMGIISSANRPTLLDSPFQDFLQTDAAINPGSSGGPLLDARGKVVGINTATSDSSNSGISFALPSHAAKQVLDQLLERGTVPRGWIGVQLGVVSPARAAMAGLPHPSGAYVESLNSDATAPARQAGVQVADICTVFQGQPVTGPVGLVRQIAGHAIGTVAKLTVVRNGRTIDLTVMVGLRP